MASERITAITRTDPGFYALLGPYLASRQVVKTVGGPIWDDDEKTWLVAQRGSRLTGFIAVTGRGAGAVIESCYTADDDVGLVARLVAAAVEHAGPVRLTATVRHHLAKPYRDAGFTPARETLHFVHLVREP